jgi:hypothetical protein
MACHSEVASAPGWIAMFLTSEKEEYPLQMPSGIHTLLPGSSLGMHFPLRIFLHALHICTLNRYYALWIASYYP